MSSPRTAVGPSGLIHRGEACVGPIQLPIKTPDAFLEEFNRCYRVVGLRVESYEIDVSEKSEVESQG